MKFEYRARDKKGNIQSGEIDASNKESAILAIQSYGLFVVSVEEVKVPFYKKDLPPLFERVTGREIVMISRQLAMMAESKISIVESLQTLSKQLEKRTLREKILSVSNKVEGGMSFSKALSQYPEIFSDFYVNMVKSGEESGKVSEALSSLADHIEREYVFQQKVKGAMFYPLFILVIFLGIMIFLFVVIMPELTEMLLDAGEDLPLPTKIIMGFSDFLVENGWIVIVAVYSTIVFSIKFFTTNQGKELLDKAFIKAPVLKEFFQKIYTIRFSTSFASLTTAGVPIVKSLQISADIVQNLVYREAVLEIAVNVERGLQVSDSMKKRPDIFNPMMVQTAYVGEKSGRLGVSLSNMAKFLQDELSRTLDKYIGMIEPILIIMLGVMVGGLVAAVLLPIYNMSMAI
jgi:type IV pilus assembly protein PilC